MTKVINVNDEFEIYFRRKVSMKFHTQKIKGYIIIIDLSYIQIMSG